MPWATTALHHAAARRLLLPRIGTDEALGYTVAKCPRSAKSAELDAEFPVVHRAPPLQGALRSEDGPPTLHVGVDMVRTQMDEFPRDIRPSDGQRPTTIICPDCGGNILVRAIGEDVSDNARLMFQCRVGHAYALDELLIGKEHNIERAMWAALYAYEELGGILRTIGWHNGRDTDAIPDPQYHERTLRADEIAAAVRALIERDAVIKMKPDVDGG